MLAMNAFAGYINILSGLQHDLLQLGKICNVVGNHFASISRIDAIFTTVADNDHLVGIPYVNGVSPWRSVNVAANVVGNNEAHG